MPRPVGHGAKREKSKDFNGSMIRLYKSLGKWKKPLIISIFLALTSAILSTIAPNKLAKVTDVISEGIEPNIAMLEKISTEIMTTATYNYVLEEDHKAEDFMYLDMTEKKKYLSTITINETKISTSDQIEYLTILQKLNSQDTSEKLLKELDKMPESIQTLIQPKIDMDLLKERAIILAIIYLFSSSFIYIQDIILAYMSNGYAKGLRTSISNKINQLPLKYFDTHETGDLLSRVTNDVDSIGMNINQSIATLVTSVTIFIGSIVMMFVTNWIMAFTAIASSVIGFLISIILLKKSQKYFMERQETLGNLNGHIEEIYSGHNVVKTYNGEKEALEEFDILNEKLYDCNRKSQFLSGIMQPVMAFIGNLGYVSVCVVGALLVMYDKTTFGVIVAFMIYVRLFTRPLSQIAQALTALQSTAAAAERVFDFLDEKEQTNEDQLPEKLEIKDAKGNIEFKHVSFGYDSSRMIIKDFSAKVSSGQKIAIVGPTGAGKTTIVNLLMKFYEINDGDIIIDGKSIKDLKRENIHNLFCMVLQDTWLFDGTIKDNVKYNQEDISDETIWEACRIVGIDHFIKTLPGGIYSQVGDNEAISSGQKQLITLARGMLEDSPFLILDEATSNVDTRTEELVQKAMDKLTVGRTSFIIAHRLSTIKNADLILVLDDGNIVEQGTHDELLKKNGFYANLYNSQFQR